MRRVFPYLFCLLACGLAGIAIAQAPVVSPQWSSTFSARERVDDIAFPQPRESWAELGDGKTVLLSRRPHGGAATLHAFDSAGQLIESRYLGVGSYENAWLAAARQSSSLYVLEAPLPEFTTYPSFRSYLHRYLPGSDAQQIAQIFKSPEVQVDPAQALQVLEDDSVLVLTQYSIGRISAGGATQWFRYSDPISGGHFQPLAMTQGPDGVFWLAGRGGTKDGGAAPASAAVWRLRADGTFLSTQTYRCTGCSDSRALGISVLPDGRAVAVGRGAAGEPGFIVLFEADGSVFRRIDTAPDQGYDRVIHDQAGHVYLFANDRQQISAIDAGDGTLRWTHPGSDVAPLDAGVLISRPVASTGGALIVDAYDAGGQLRWSREIENTNGLATGGAELGADGVIRVFSALAIAASGDCGSSPRLHKLDLDGTPLGRLAACLRELYVLIPELDILPVAGVMVDTGRTAEVLTPGGQLAWRYAACDFCTSGYASIAGLQLQPDRSAWVLVNIYNVPMAEMQAELLRVSAGGQVLLRVPMTLPAYGLDFRPVLLGDAQQVIVFAPGPDSLQRSRYTAGGELREIVRYDWSEAREATRLSVQPLEDGGVTLRAFRFDTDSCQPSPPICGPSQNTLLRVGAEGELRWRQELGDLPTYVGLESDGGAVAFFSSSDAETMSRLRHIDAQGLPGADIEIAGSSDNGYGVAFSGPVGGRYLATRARTAQTVGENLLFDRSGAVFARRPAPEGGLPLAYSSAGFLVDHNYNDAQLLSAQDLTPIATFTMGNDMPIFINWSLWGLTDDGDVYTTERPVSDLRRRARVTRFALPGTPAAEVIFSARFD